MCTMGQKTLWSIFLLSRMSHWCCKMVDGAEFWISCQQQTLLRKASHWQLIQNSVIHIGAFTNYVYKRRGVGGQKNWLFVNFHAIENVNGGGRWSKKAKFCKRSLWTPPYLVQLMEHPILRISYILFVCFLTIFSDKSFQLI